MRCQWRRPSPLWRPWRRVSQESRRAWSPGCAAQLKTRPIKLRTLRLHLDRQHRSWVVAEVSRSPAYRLRAGVTGRDWLCDHDYGPRRLHKNPVGFGISLWPCLKTLNHRQEGSHRYIWAQLDAFAGEVAVVVASSMHPDGNDGQRLGARLHEERNCKKVVAEPVVVTYSWAKASSHMHHSWIPSIKQASHPLFMSSPLASHSSSQPQE